MSDMLSQAELQRYSRHLQIPEFGVEKQEALKQSRVLCVGTGGLGSPAALYLAASGVGTLGLIDFDEVDVTNLQRQILHGNKDVGRPKIESALETLQDINPHVHLVSHPHRLEEGNVMEIIHQYDVVVDGSDNFPTRYLVNDACVLLNKPLIYGSIFRFEGQASVFWADKGPCYRCLYPEPPSPGMVPNCAEAGVLGVLPGVIGTLQANEAVKVITGIGTPLIGRLLLYDALELTFREMKLTKDPDCPICGTNPSITEVKEIDFTCTVPESSSDDAISVRELHQALEAGEQPFLLDIREPYERDICRLENDNAIPMAQVPDRLSELPKDKPVIVYCRSGARSQTITDFLQKNGYSQTKNLTGGILAWSDEIDPSLPKY